MHACRCFNRNAVACRGHRAALSGLQTAGMKTFFAALLVVMLAACDPFTHTDAFFPEPPLGEELY